MSDINFISRICLFDKRCTISIGSEPEAFPCFIRPRQTKREIWFPAFQNFLERSLQQLLPVTKPVVPIDKSLNSIFLCKLSLRFPCLPQIIIAQISRNVRLIMSKE